MLIMIAYAIMNLFYEELFSKDILSKSEEYVKLNNECKSARGDVLKKKKKELNIIRRKIINCTEVTKNEFSNTNWQITLKLVTTLVVFVSSFLPLFTN